MRVPNDQQSAQKSYAEITSHISDVHKQVYLAADYNLDSHDVRRMKVYREPEI